MSTNWWILSCDARPILNNTGNKVCTLSHVFNKKMERRIDNRLLMRNKDENFRTVASHFLENFSQLTGHFGLWKDWQTVYQHFSFGCVERAYLGRTMIRIWSKFMFLFLPPGDFGFAYMTLSLTRMRWRQKAALNTEPELSPTIQECSGLARTAKMKL